MYGSVQLLVRKRLSGEDVSRHFVDYDSKAELHLFRQSKVNGGRIWPTSQTRLRMAKLGIDQVLIAGYALTGISAFYSYRRDGVTGRQATFIWINEN